MRISDAPSPDAAPQVKPAASPATKDAEHAAAPGSAQDEVSLGPVALAASSSLDAPDARIVELRQQYLDGSYQVEAHKLGAKIVDEHLLGGAVPDERSEK